MEHSENVPEASPRCLDEPIWSPDELAGLLEHEAPDVRAWALGRLLELELDECLEGKLTGLLDDEDPGMVSRALDALSRVGAANALAPLQALMQSPDASEDHKDTARALAAGMGDGNAQRQILDAMGNRVPCRVADWASRDPEGFLQAVKEEWPERLPASPALLGALVDLGAGDYATAILQAARAFGDDKAQELLDEVVVRAGAYVPRRSAPGAESWAWVGTDANGADSWAAEAGVIGAPLTAELDALYAAIERRSWKKVLRRALGACEALGSHACAGAPGSIQLAWGLALARAMARVGVKTGSAESRAAIVCRLLWGLRSTARAGQAARTDTGLTPLLAAMEYARMDAYAELADLVGVRWAETAGQPDARQRATQELTQWLEEAPAFDLTFRLEFLAGLEGFQAAEWALTRWERLRSDDEAHKERAAIEDAFAEILRQRPDVLRERAKDLIEAGDGVCLTTLYALRALNARWATNTTLDSLDSVLVQPDTEVVWEALMDLGDPAALGRVIAEWRPGESLIAECAALLARLDGSFDRLPKELQEAAAMQESRDAILDAALRSRQPLEDLMATNKERPLHLRLRCTECGRSYTYEVDRVYIDPEAAETDKPNWSGSAVPNRIITCKNCGARDRYEITSDGRWALIAGLTASLGEKSVLDGRVIPAKIRLADGTDVRRPSEAIDHLREEAERHPRNGAAWRRLGNLCARMGEKQEAEEAWRKAVRADDREVEAAYSLAEWLWDSGRAGEAAAFVLMAIERMPRAEIDAEMRQGLADELVAMLEELVPHLQPPAALMATWCDGSRFGDPIVALSDVDLRRIRRWDRLAELIGKNAFASLGFTSEIPGDDGSQLEALIEKRRDVPRRVEGRDGLPAEPERPEPAQAEKKVGRNQPCPCGSGRKYKHCCGRTA